MELSPREERLRLGEIPRGVDLHNRMLSFDKVPEGRWEHPVRSNAKLHPNSLGCLLIVVRAVLFIPSGV